MQTVTITLPDKIYRRLQSAAKIAGKSIHELAAQSVQATLPPVMDAIPARYRNNLRVMEKLSDDDLWAMARSSVDAKLQRRLRLFLRKNSNGALTEAERKALAELRSSADLVMLRKAYAFLLLKWRGHRIPSLAELENGA